jgi:hypothetical protein
MPVKRGVFQRGAAASGLKELLPRTESGRVTEGLGTHKFPAVVACRLAGEAKGAPIMAGGKTFKRDQKRRKEMARKLKQDEKLRKKMERREVKKQEGDVGEEPEPGPSVL